jgi:hypothetical protein
MKTLTLRLSEENKIALLDIQRRHEGTSQNNLINLIMKEGMKALATSGSVMIRAGNGENVSNKNLQLQMAPKCKLYVEDGELIFEKDGIKTKIA